MSIINPVKDFIHQKNLLNANTIINIMFMFNFSLKNIYFNKWKNSELICKYYNWIERNTIVELDFGSLIII